MRLSIFRIPALLALATFFVLGGDASLSLAQRPDANIERLEDLSFKQASALVSPSVVRIQTVGGLERIGQILTGTGPTTGVVVSPDGYIISSSFNFASQPASVLVSLLDGRRFAAKVVAHDRARMLTLLKIDADDLIPVQAAEKKSIRVGQWAIALGRTYENPAPNIAVGIVSALNRMWGKAIQTDAKVSPANYGGPLVNVDGRVLGVLVPLSPQGSGETAGVEWYDSGIGFAIPMEDIYATLERLKTGKDLHPGLLGISIKGGNMYADPPVVDRVRYNSPAQKAGLKPGDVITSIDGRAVTRQTEVRYALGTRLADDKVAMTVKRDSQVIDVVMTFVAELQPYESGFLGILPARETSEPQADAGVGIRYVYAGSPAEKVGLKPKDRLVRMNDTQLTGVNVLADLVSRLLPGDKATLVFQRDGTEKTVEFEVSAVPNVIPEDLLSVEIPAGAKAEPAPLKEKAADAAKEKADSDKDDFDKDDSGKDESGKDAKPPEENAPPRTGRFTETVAAYEHSYWAYVPEDYNPAYQYGLLVWIHPGGDTMEAAIYRQWKSICDRRGIIILAPKATKIGGWSPDEGEFVKDTVAAFQEKYSIDPARVFLHGFDSGGRFAYFLAFKFREMFRGVAVAAAPLSAPPPENQPDLRLQLHLVCGEDDPLLLPVRATVEALRRLKFPASFTTVKGYGHKYPAEAPVDEIGRWADSLDRI